MRRSHRKVWLEPENFPKEMLLTGPKFHLNTTSGSGVTLKKEIFAIYDLIRKHLFRKYRQNDTS